MPAEARWELSASFADRDDAFSKMMMLEVVSRAEILSSLERLRPILAFYRERIALPRPGLLDTHIYATWSKTASACDREANVVLH